MVINLLNEAIPYPIGSPEYKAVVLEAVNEARAKIERPALRVLPNGAHGGTFFSCAVGMCFAMGDNDDLIGHTAAADFARWTAIGYQYEHNFERGCLPEIGTGSYASARNHYEHVF